MLDDARDCKEALQAPCHILLLQNKLEDIMESIELEIYKCPFCNAVPTLGKSCEGICLYCSCRELSSDYSENLEQVVESWNSVCLKNAGGGGC